MDEVAARRQQRCAERPEGHNFWESHDGKICENCGLEVLIPPDSENPTLRELLERGGSDGQS